jgi:glycosyltransferase involved in cell wall biosynthesis
MKVSIIIPTLNEEKMLPRLLDSIKNQDFDGYEVIVADAQSKDSTREIAEQHGCRIVEGGLPAAGRNAGASAALGDILFFLDADVVIPQGFIRNVYDEMQDRYHDLATCEIRPLSDYRLDRVLHRMINLAVILNLRVDPKAFGFCIFVTKRLFDRIGGFDETIYVAEDNDFVKRASEFRTLRYLSSAYLMVSIRRFEKEGRFAYMHKGIKLNLYRTFKGEIRNAEVVTYDFEDYDKPEGPEDTDFLDWLEDRLIKIEKNSRGGSTKIQKHPDVPDFKQMQPRINEFSHLMEDLDAYLSKDEQIVQRIVKWKNFFKRRHSHKKKETK